MTEIRKHYQLIEEYYIDKKKEDQWNEIKSTLKVPSLKGMMRTISKASEQGITVEKALEYRYLKKQFV